MDKGTPLETETVKSQRFNQPSLPPSEQIMW